MTLKISPTILTLCATLSAGAVFAAEEPVADAFIEKQRVLLSETTDGVGFGPQSPRDIGFVGGNNARSFEEAPDYTAMNLCNIHFHEGAEHKGGEFTTYAGNGNGKGYGTGYLFDGTLSEAELAPYGSKVGENDYGFLAPGDTIEIHYVHSSAKITPGPTLGSCLSEAIMNPQLRVEAVVMVLVNDDSAADLVELTEVAMMSGYHQAINLPGGLGDPVEYAGSTTGPSYNEKGSPLQVSWSVRPQVLKVSISSVQAWFEDNIFNEEYAHAVRNLVQNPNLLSKIQ